MLQAWVGLGITAERLGAPEAALEHFRHAAVIVTTMDPCFLAVSARRHLGACLLRLGHIEEAAAQLNACMALTTTMPESLEVAPTLVAVAELHYQNDRQAAIGHAERGLHAARTAEATAQAHVFLARAYAADEAPRAALEHARDAERIAERYAGLWFGLRARAELAQLNLSSAVDLTRSS
jgi:tetratricopeptide (TPR) repeat protein